MLIDILLTLPILALFVLVTARCLVPESAESSTAAVCNRQELLKVFCFAVLFRLFMLSVMFLCSMFSSGDRGLDAIPDSFTRWDGRHYINLIEKGYTGYIEDGRHLFLVFYPLYVWVSRIVRLIVPNTIIAGLAVSIFSYALGCCYVYCIAAQRLGRDTARDSIILLSLYPFSFFYGTIMTEGLFLLTTSAACCYAMQRRWILYGIFGALAALTRMTGILVIVPAVVELISEVRPLEKPLRFIKRLPAIAMPLLGALGYLLLNWYVDQDPFAFRVHQAHWYQGGMWVSKVLRYLWNYFIDNLTTSNGFAVWLPELLLFAVSFIIIAVSVRNKKIPPSMLAYTFCCLVANYSLSWLLSAGRYLSVCFPLFILGAVLIKDRPKLRQAVYTAEAVLLGIYFYAYLTGAQVM